KLHEEYKVPQELRDFYYSQLVVEAQRNPNMPISKLPEVYKQVHERMSKFLDGQRRDERGRYVATKKADARIPGTRKGVETQGSKKAVEIPSGVDEREYLRSQIVKTALARARGG